MTPPAASACGTRSSSALPPPRDAGGAPRTRRAGRILTCPRPRGHAPPAATPPSTPSLGATPAVRVQVQGAELVRGRQDYTVYRLVVLSENVASWTEPAEPSYRRFSQFTELLARVRRRLVALGAPTAEIDEWRRLLTAERRHAGALALAPAVVEQRCTVLQRLIDRLLTQPPYVALPDVRVFLGIATTDAAAASAGGWHRVACPRCQRPLRVQAAAMVRPLKCSGCALVFAVQAPGAAAPPATPALPSPLDGGDDATRSRGTSCLSSASGATSLSASDAAAAAAAAAASIASIADELDRGPSAEVAAAGGGARGGGLLGGMSVADSTTFGAFINSFGQRTAAPAPASAPPPPESSGFDAPAVTSQLTPQSAAQTERAADLAAALFFSG